MFSNSEDALSHTHIWGFDIQPAHSNKSSPSSVLKYQRRAAKN